MTYLTCITGISSTFLHVTLANIYVTNINVNEYNGLNVNEDIS